MQFRADIREQEQYARNAQDGLGWLGTIDSTLGDMVTQVQRVRDLRASRDDDAVRKALAEVEAAARGTDNLLYPMREALRVRATLGEVSDVLRGVFGEYRPGR